MRTRGQQELRFEYLETKQEKKKEKKDSHDLKPPYMVHILSSEEKIA
jgi:hypothetical protein